MSSKLDYHLLVKNETAKFQRFGSLIFLTFLTFWNVLCAQEPAYHSQSTIENGIQVAFSMHHIDITKPPLEFREGDDVRFRFTITDTLTNNGLSGVFPAAWMSLNPEGKPTQNCTAKLGGFLSGSLLNRAELDLNVYYVLTLNVDNTISVVDPLFGYGTTKFLALIQLETPGQDWVLNQQQDEIFVTMPASNAVAAINAYSWTVDQNIDIGATPYHIKIQPDEAYLWVDFRTESGESGVAVIDRKEQRLIKRIPTASGPHQIAISADSRFAYVSNFHAGSVTIIDIQTLEKLGEVFLGGHPNTLAYSEVAQAVYTTTLEGDILAIDKSNLQILGRMTAQPGINYFKFAPDNRLGLALNADSSEVYVIDAAVNRIVQTGDLLKKPTQINFTNEFAYVVHDEDPFIRAIPLNSLGKEGKPITVIDLPSGQNPSGKSSFPISTDMIVKTPGSAAILVANPMDKMIYFYHEGMTAPKGTFSNDRREMLGVNVVDRSLNEVRPGVYETVAKLREPGFYDVVFFMDAPRFIHCFDVNISADYDIRLARTIEHYGTIAVQYFMEKERGKAGEEVTVEIGLRDIQTNQILTGLEDVEILCVHGGGQYHKMHRAIETKTPGIYQTKLTLTDTGVYYFYVQSLSREFTFSNPQYLLFHVQ